MGHHDGLKLFLSGGRSPFKQKKSSKRSSHRHSRKTRVPSDDSESPELSSDDEPPRAGPSSRQTSNFDTNSSGGPRGGRRPPPGPGNSQGTARNSNGPPSAFPQSAGRGRNTPQGSTFGPRSGGPPPGFGLPPPYELSESESDDPSVGPPPTMGGFSQVPRGSGGFPTARPPPTAIDPALHRPSLSAMPSMQPTSNTGSSYRRSFDPSTIVYAKHHLPQSVPSAPNSVPQSTMPPPRSAPTMGPRPSMPGFADKSEGSYSEEEEYSVSGSE